MLIGRAIRVTVALSGCCVSSVPAKKKILETTKKISKKKILFGDDKIYFSDLAGCTWSHPIEALFQLIQLDPPKTGPRAAACGSSTPRTPSMQSGSIQAC
jgi:hypothetical protein